MRTRRSSSETVSLRTIRDQNVSAVDPPGGGCTEGWQGVGGTLNVQEKAHKGGCELGLVKSALRNRTGGRRTVTGVPCPSPHSTSCLVVYRWIPVKLPTEVV
jgi:hypothetical protein